MARQLIDVGAKANDGTGDPLRTSQIKVNENFEELYASVLFEDEILTARSLAAMQFPTGSDVALQVEFGQPVMSSGGEIELDVDGVSTVIIGGTFHFSVYMNTGRSGATGVTELYGRALINGSQMTSSVLSRIDDAEINTPLQFQFTASLPAGTEITFEIFRDSQGDNSGGLSMYTPTLPDWLASPSASIVIRKAKPATDVIPPSRNNLILVQDPTDLPEAILGVRLLTENVDYEINGTIDLGTDRIQRNGANRIYGVNAALDVLKTDNTLPMIFGDNTSQVSEHLTFSNLNGPIFAAKSTAGFEKTGAITLNYCFLTNSPDIGTVESLKILQITNCILDNLGNGLTIAGSNNIIQISSNLVEPTVIGTVVALDGSVNDVITIDNNSIEPVLGVVFLSGLAGSANLSVQGSGSVRNNVSHGAEVAGLVGISPLDNRWVFDGNNTVVDTPFAGSMYLENNGTATPVIQGVPIKIAGTSTPTVESRFQMTGNLEMTYTGEKTLFAGIGVSLNAKKTGGGGEKSYVFSLYHNGAPLAGGSSATQVKDKTSSSGIHGVVLLNQGDVISVFVEATDSPDQITISGLQFIIAKL